MSARPRLVSSLLALALSAGGLLGAAAPPAAAATSVISGTVTDLAGNPLEGISVSADNLSDDGFGGGASTDADGNYSITDLDAGSYRIEFTDFDGVFNDEYYDDAQLEADAQTVTVAAGASRSGIDAEMGLLTPAAPALTSGPRFGCECGGKYIFDNPDYADFVRGAVIWDFAGVPQDPANTYHLTSTPALPAGAASATHFVDDGLVLAFTNRLELGTSYTFVIEERSGSTVVASSAPFDYTLERTGAPSTLQILDSSGEPMNVFGDAEDSFVAGASYTVRFTGEWAAGATFWNALNFFDPENGLTLGVGGASSAPWTGFTIPRDYAGRDVLVEIVGGTPDALAVFFATARVPVVGDGTSPLNLTPATVTGTPKVGGSLYARGGESVAAPSRTYQWLRDGAPIRGATLTTYRLGTADAGRRISVRITGTKPGFATSSVTSAATPVTAYNSRRPTVSGTPQAGRTLSATRGTWSAPGFTYSYQWLRGGRTIAGATRTTYRLASADRGTSISVRVTARRSGFASVAVTSSARRVR